MWSGFPTGAMVKAREIVHCPRNNCRDPFLRAHFCGGRSEQDRAQRRYGPKDCGRTRARRYPAVLYSIRVRLHRPDSARICGAANPYWKRALPIVRFLAEHETGVTLVMWAFLGLGAMIALPFAWFNLSGFQLP